MAFRHRYGSRVRCRSSISFRETETQRGWQNTAHSPYGQWEKHPQELPCTACAPVWGAGEQRRPCVRAVGWLTAVSLAPCSTYHRLLSVVLSPLPPTSASLGLSSSSPSWTDLYFMTQALLACQMASVLLPCRCRPTTVQGCVEMGRISKEQHWGFSTVWCPDVVSALS